MAEKEKALIAGLCTSGTKVKLSLLAGGKFYALTKKARNQEKVIFKMFDRLLGPRKGLKDISALCVITGPGRFTGLRIGLTLASALKTLAGIKVYSSTLFEILAAQAAASKEFRTWAAGRKAPRVLTLVHAFKNEYFCQLFSRQGGAIRPAEVPLWLQDAELTAYLETLGGDAWVIADAEEKDDIYSLVPAGLEKAPARISKILPDFIIKTGLVLKNRDLAPLYLKPAKYELEQRAKTKAL